MEGRGQIILLPRYRCAVAAVGTGRFRKVKVKPWVKHATLTVKTAPHRIMVIFLRTPLPSAKLE